MKHQPTISGDLREPESGSDHIDAVLEPITPSSCYAFVDIEQNRIPFHEPVSGIIDLAPSIIWSAIWFTKDQWKTVILVVTLLFITEISARTLEPRLVGRIYNNTQTAGYPLAVNKQGTRGSIVQVPKPENTVRVLALGDSVTFGTGMPFEKAWPAQLQLIMNQSNGTTEVINAGLPAMDLGQMNFELRSRWEQFQPDEIVVALTGNMISFAHARRDRGTITSFDSQKRVETPTGSPGIKDHIKSLYASFALPGVFTMGMEQLKFALGVEDHRYDVDFPVGVMPAFGYAQADADPDLPETAYGIISSQLEDLQKTTTELGARLTVIYSPPRFTLTDEMYNNPKHVDRARLTIDPQQRLRSICEQLNIRFIDPSDALRNAPSPVYVLFDYTHFDESGHRAIAALLAESISSD